MKKLQLINTKQKNITINIKDLIKIRVVSINAEYAGYYYYRTKSTIQYIGKYFDKNCFFYVSAELKREEALKDIIYHLDISSCGETKRLGDSLKKEYPNAKIIDYYQNKIEEGIISVKKL